MDKKTFFLVLLAVLAIAGYLGWNEYRKSVSEEQLFRQRLQQEEQQHQKEMVEAQRKLEEEKRLAEEQRKREAQEMLSEENRTVMEKVRQKRKDALAQLKGLIESKGNGTIERQEADQIWARKISESAFFHSDSLCTYSYRTGNESETLVEIQFNLAQIGVLKPIAEKNAKTNYYFLEVTTQYQQKIFTYCEKHIGRADCEKSKEINTFRIFFDNPKASSSAFSLLGQLGKLYTSDFEMLKKMIQTNEL